MLYTPNCCNKLHPRLIAFDLDGTLTKPQSPIEPQNLQFLEQMSKRYHLVIIGAGSCRRIFEQIKHFQIDIIGNYGMEGAEYDAEKDDIRMIFSHTVPLQPEPRGREVMEQRIHRLRHMFGFTDYVGESAEFYASGCVTFPILGTAAPLDRKMALDPDRTIRRPLLARVREVIPEYNVFIGGTSSFDFTPAGFDKYHALAEYCRVHGYTHEEVLFSGDDYGDGGNDASVYTSEIAFLPVHDYHQLPTLYKAFLN
ncbi:MAG: HAD family phosphatase [Clostridia bacterium]|nr:HAD family phosphatase [Clostridia bacterium]